MAILTGTEETLKEVFSAWVSDAVNSVHDRARILVSGQLLKARSGKLRDSIFRKYPYPSDTEVVGEVGTGLNYGVIWELYGVHGPFGSKTAGGNLKIRLPFEGSLRGVGFAGKGKGASGSKFQSSIIFRKSSYNRVRYKAPVQFLKRSLMDEMTGGKGNSKLGRLGLSIGNVTLNRFNRMWSGNYGANIRVTIS